MVLSRPRSASSSRMVTSSALSASPGLWPRQASEQYFTASQSFSHFLRQEKLRPQDWQIFSFLGVSRSGLRTLSGMVWAF